MHDAVKSPARFLILFALVIAALFQPGCSNEPVVGPGDATTSSAAAKVNRDDELRNAMRYVRQMNEYDYDKASEKALGSLNAWSSSLEDDPNFKVDPLRERLPKEIKPYFPADGLAGEKFRSDDYSFVRQYLNAPPAQAPIGAGVRSNDYRYLHETSLIKRIAEWAVKQPADPQTEDWLDAQSPKMDEQAARKLRDVTRLFDWTVRHLQLEPAAPEPARTSQGPSSDTAAQQAALPPALAGKPGPGYTQFPGHLLVMGRADFIQRAWVFCLLARQVQCDVVMLAFENAETSRPEPWLPAALIGGELYLYDTQLGLPLPGEGDIGIVTLSQVKANDALLRRLDLSAEMVYPANADNLKRVVALVELSDAALSKRMTQLESRLTGDDQMTLAVKPSEIAEAVRKTGAVSQVYPWRIAYDTILFRAFIDASLRKDFQYYMQYYSLESPFLRPSPLALARYKHLEGDLIGGEEDEGAIAAYLASRVPDAAINQYEQSPQAQELLKTKMIGDRELSPQDKMQMITAQKNSMMLSKLHASYFMGQAQFDLGAFRVAQDWFQKQTLGAANVGPWQPGASYNLARTLEMQKKYREARDLLLADQSPQKQGNLIRARRLRPLADAESAPKAEKANADASPDASLKKDEPEKD